MNASQAKDNVFLTSPGILCLSIYFQMAPLDVKRKMLSSIFPGKLIYQDGKYRTEGMNPALMLIIQKTNGLQKEKPETSSFLKMSPGCADPKTALELLRSSIGVRLIKLCLL